MPYAPLYRMHDAYQDFPLLTSNFLGLCLRNTTAKLLDCRIDQINEVVVARYGLVPVWYLVKPLCKPFTVPIIYSMIWFQFEIGDGDGADDYANDDDLEKTIEAVVLEPCPDEYELIEWRFEAAGA